jgi:hypothetical protein
MNNIYQIKASNSRQEPEVRIQNLIIAYCEKIYKLKGEMRKRDQFVGIWIGGYN